MKISINNLNKAEELPIHTKMIMNVPNNILFRKPYRGKEVNKKQYAILRGCVGMLWSDVVKKLKEVTPEEYHSYIYNLVETIKQDNTNGKWYSRRNSGKFVGYGFKTASEVKNFNHYKGYYINKDGILKKYPYKNSRKTSDQFHKVRVQETRKYERIKNHLINKADFHITRDNKLQNISFPHPTKTYGKRFYNREKKCWEIDEETRLPIMVTTSPSSFKKWCNDFNYTYIITYENLKSVDTNMKWEIK